MALVVAEIFAHGACRVRRDVLKRSRLPGGGGHYNGVVHRAGIGQRFYYFRDRRGLLSDAAVNSNYASAFLVDDGVENDRGPARLAVAHNQLALPASDGEHLVD